MAHESYAEALERLKKSLDRLAELAERQGAAALGLGGGTAPAADAFGVVSLGKNQGYGSLDHTGVNLSGEFFADRRTADAFAETHKRFYDRLAAKFAPPPSAAQAAPVGKAVAAAVFGAAVPAGPGLGDGFAAALGRARDRAAGGGAFAALPPPPGGLDPVSWARVPGPKAESAYSWRRRMEGFAAAAAGDPATGAASTRPASPAVSAPAPAATPLARSPQVPARAFATPPPATAGGGRMGPPGSFGNPLDVAGGPTPLARVRPGPAAQVRYRYGTPRSTKRSAWRRAAAFARRGYRAWGPGARAAAGSAWDWAGQHAPGGPRAKRAWRAGMNFAHASARFAAAAPRAAGFASTAARMMGAGPRLASAAGLAAGGGAAALSAASASASLTSFGAAVYAAAERAREYAERVGDSNRHLARYNGVIAGGYGELDRGQYHRDVRHARATEGTSLTLTRGLDRMRTGWEGADAFGANLANRAGGFAAGFSGSVGAKASQFAGWLGGLADRFDPNGLVSHGAGAGVGAALAALPEALAAEIAAHPIVAATGLGVLGLLPGAVQRAGEIGAKAADAAVAAAAAPGAFSDRWARGMHELVRGGPIRGNRPFPDFGKP